MKIVNTFCRKVRKLFQTTVKAVKHEVAIARAEQHQNQEALATAPRAMYVCSGCPYPSHIPNQRQRRKRNRQA